MNIATLISFAFKRLSVAHSMRNYYTPHAHKSAGGVSVSKKPNQAIRNKAYWLILVQVVLVLVAAVIVLLTMNLKTAYSLLLGGLVSILPNFYFARRLFRPVFVSKARQLLLNFYRNEVIKLILMGVLFVIILKLNIVVDLAFIIGFILAQFSALLWPLFIGAVILS